MMKSEEMKQPEAEEIANSWKYDGEYAFYDMAADPEDYEEIVCRNLWGSRYFSVFGHDALIGFFCVEQEESFIELGLGLRPDLTGHGKGSAFLEEILCFVKKRYLFESIHLDVASFNQRAIKVYERAGFVKTGSVLVATNGGQYDFTQMELKSI